jgi:hypothetical protein
MQEIDPFTTFDSVSVRAAVGFDTRRQEEIFEVLSVPISLLAHKMKGQLQKDGYDAARLFKREISRWRSKQRRARALACAGPQKSVCT